MLNNYPDTFTAVQIHPFSDGYNTAWSAARGTFYGVGGTPSARFDGVLTCHGAQPSVGQQYTWFLDQYNARQAVPTDVTIELCGVEDSAPTFDVTARVCIEPGGTGKTMRIHMVQVLDNWPNPPTYSRYTQVLANNAPDITLGAGECAEVETSFTFDSASWSNQEDIKIVAWAQDTLSSGPSEVYQAAQMHWPFEACALELDWVDVGDAGNTGELSGAGAGGAGPDRICGAVDYEYRIGMFEVTNEEYLDFLQMVASEDTNGLYNAGMSGTDGGIVQEGSSPNYTYRIKDDTWLRKPVNYVNFYDALRFANWMHNGQPEGAQDASTTEDGAYDMSLGAAVVRKPGALFFLTSEDEWYKAAYYKSGGTGAGYWDYPTAWDTAPTCEVPPGTDAVNGSANCDDAVGGLTDVGAYNFKPSVSAYGTFDQAGNVWEWTEEDLNGDGSRRVIRGASFYAPSGSAQMHAAHRDSIVPGDYFNIGFRLASFADCDENGIPDLCDFDCTAVDGVFCDIAGCGLGTDCNGNEYLDVCDILECPEADPACADCNGNDFPDECDLDPSDPDGNGQVSPDCDSNLVPDECQPDCDGDDTPDVCELCPFGSSMDCNLNDIPDECDIADGFSEDCQANGRPDECDVYAGAGMTDPASWNTYDAGANGVGVDPDGYRGAIYDGTRHVYFVPSRNEVGQPHAEVLRYNTSLGSFDNPASWTSYEPTGTIGDFAGGAFDGQYVYFAPAGHGSYAQILRYDTQSAFDNPAAWETCQPAGTDGGYSGAVFAGDHVYFVPYDTTGGANSTVLRFDTQTGGGFCDAGSWETYDPGTAGMYRGGAFDGRYLYLAGHGGSTAGTIHGEMLQYDTQGAFDDAASWVAFDTVADPDLQAKGGYTGVVQAERFVYFIPDMDNTGAYHGQVLRFDTAAGQWFDDEFFWRKFEFAVADECDPCMDCNNPVGYDGAVYDGQQFVYFVPHHRGGAQPHGEVLRLDTAGEFNDASSWATYDYGISSECAADPGCVDPDGYSGAATDGRYVYFSPLENEPGAYHGEVLRLDTMVGWSRDCDDGGIPDECEIVAPTTAVDDVTKNRYLSFDPENDGLCTGFQVAVTSSVLFPTCSGIVGWVGEPFEAEPGVWVARVTDEPYFGGDWPAEVHIADCEIAPTTAYEVRASADGIGFSAPLAVSTIDLPAPKYWCDVVGDFIEGAWTAPQGTVNMSDIMAVLQKFSSAPGAPPLPWMDLDPEVPNTIVNMTDVQRAVECFKGGYYPFSDPCACP